MAHVVRFLLLISVTSPLMAGMPSISLSDVWSMRLQSISFFLLVLVLTAAGVMALWNHLRRDFTALPRLTYLRSLSLVLLLGLLFMVVLTMISGARELMTPGAWKKQGLTYTLAAGGTSGDAEHLRRSRLEALRVELWRYADAHDDEFPAHDLTKELSEDIWWADVGRTQRFHYVAGGKRNDRARPIAYEPRHANGKERLVLMGDGKIHSCTDQQLIALLEQRQ